MRILVVEDDAVSLKLVASILEKNQFEVETAKSAKEAITFLRRESRIDIILSDIIMPEVDGFELLRFLKADRRLRRIPVILYSCLGEEKSVVKGLELGATDYIVKPINADTLLAKIRQAQEKIPGAVLVDDDEELLRGLVARILEREGYRVLVAGSGTEALQVMEQNRVAVVLSDIKMPEMSGLELLVQVKANYPDTPVLLMTGHGSEYSKEDVLAAGADSYITKPFKNTEIVARVQPFLE